jgi:hypothetical protein
MDREKLPAPLDDFTVTWYEHHPQAEPHRWRAVARWDKGPLAIHKDGDDRAAVLEALVAAVTAAMRR